MLGLDMDKVANGEQQIKSIGKGLKLMSCSPQHMAKFAEEGTLTPSTVVFNPPALQIMSSNVEMLKRMLLEESLDLRYSCLPLGSGRPTDQYPLITLAARRGECQCIELLLEHRAEIDAVARKADGSRQQVGTPVMVAIEHHRPQAAALLIKRGANPHVTDPALNTPLHLAAMVDDVETMPLLKKAGADLAAANMNGRTALHFAIKCDNPRAIDWLLSQGVPVKEADKFDETPLHYAVKMGSKKAAHLLIERGATCFSRCQKCTLQIKLVQRAIAKSAEKQAETDARAQALAAITPEDLRRAQEVAAALVAAEEELVRQEQERAAHRSSSKAQKAAQQKQRKKLRELREAVAALRDPAASGFKAAIEYGKQLSRRSLQSRFEEQASEQFIEKLTVGDDVADSTAGDEEGGLTQEEIDAWLAKLPTCSKSKEAQDTDLAE
eukprot:TRINITY_DN84376_c0_g1_i1.p1 TRINITY_DN84376_c0_g1~~TRINITY_DN84376_c0_g1_i1.p1  ORF type:complete len:460 (-),score=132.18 TRINITY_DN84376_c0_g1_i1:106-1422(-)